MTWNYRIVHHQGKQEWFGLHEVFCDEHGTIVGRTEDSISFAAESRDELIKSLELALEDARTREVIVDDDLPVSTMLLDKDQKQ